MGERNYVSEDFSHSRTPELACMRDSAWDHIRSLLTEREFACVCRCVLGDEDQSAVAAEFGIDQSTVARSIASAIQKIGANEEAIEDLQDFAAEAVAAEPRSRGGHTRSDYIDSQRGPGTWNEGTRDDA